MFGKLRNSTVGTEKEEPWDTLDDRLIKKGILHHDEYIAFNNNGGRMQAVIYKKEMTTTPLDDPEDLEARGSQ